MAQKIHMIDCGDPTLCMPDRHKSCFACCPPIRPQGYEHLSYRNIVKRILRENTAGFDPELEEIQPIRGYSCWGLGYLDSDYRLVGCLLHPARNDGVDLRYRIDYWDKCRRECCPESKTFLLLDPAQRRFWLNLSEGLDSFDYSSRKANPLFPILGWGNSVLGMIAEEASGRTLTRESFFQEYPFFTTALAPKGNAYLLRRLAADWGTHFLKDRAFEAAFGSFSREIFDSFSRKNGPLGNGTPSHLLELDQDFMDFLRLHLKIPRIEHQEALAIKQGVDDWVERFGRAHYSSFTHGLV